MKKQIKEIYQMIRGNLRSLLLFEFIFSGLLQERYWYRWEPEA